MNFKKMMLTFLCLGMLLLQAPATYAMDAVDNAAYQQDTIFPGIMGLGAVAAVIYLWSYKDMQSGYVLQAITTRNNDALHAQIQRDKTLIKRSNNQGRIPLYEAVKRQNLPAAAILLAAGANPNQQQNLIVNGQQQDGQIALVAAAKMLNQPLVGLLMASGGLSLLTNSSNRNAFEAADSVNIAVPGLMGRKNAIKELLKSPENSKEYVARLLHSHEELKSLPESVKQDLLNRIGVGQMRQAVDDFVNHNTDVQLKYELNKDRWMFRHLTQAGQERNWLSKKMTQQSGRRAALPADVVKHIRTFLDRNNIHTHELEGLLQQVAAKAVRIGNSKVLTLTRIAQKNEGDAEIAKKAIHNKNSGAKWKKNNRGLNRPRKNGVNQNA